MNAADRNLLALAESTPEAKLASWMGMSLPVLRRKLAKLQAEEASSAAPAVPETSRVVLSGPPAVFLAPGEPTASVPIARERGEAAERGASAAASPPAKRRGESSGDTILRLEAEVAWLRDRLREANAEDVAARMAGALRLTNDEARLLAVLWRRSPATVRKDALYSALHGDATDGGPDPKILDVTVCKVRRKLETIGPHIETLWGVGYRLSPIGRERVNAILVAP